MGLKSQEVAFRLDHFELERVFSLKSEISFEDDSFETSHFCAASGWWTSSSERAKCNPLLCTRLIQVLIFFNLVCEVYQSQLHLER
jgi:hypothetical protein